MRTCSCMLAAVCCCVMPSIEAMQACRQVLRNPSCSLELLMAPCWEACSACSPLMDSLMSCAKAFGKLLAVLNMLDCGG